ncbi:iron uptake transporter deferrochelatase/peroxidase subunit [Kitasatospora sp. NBC_01287]|uniref:iron uptake transporter deferrochelatase/peroxidase subunit n=1 Tax=Kitasatospora sp. NBC_01287 TaxID=2903573 RepID=UPI002256C849|nr:iron uptake transporter deferrochelatase/peroxidase subunit [Kitasatospora sp. NBC_01287]MCX4744200.1 iron uptake transporter deferrochelatase/peroxidase subunit [Kitasatospora sp. NBC_01287]
MTSHDQEPAGPGGPAPTGGVSRRRLLGGIGALGATAAAATAVTLTVRHGDDVRPTADDTQMVPFRGAHQAGIATPAQDRLCFAAFDVVPGTSRDDLAAMLRTWTAAVEAMTLGRTVPGEQEDPNSPPEDTGEAVGLTPGNLTVTIGYGPSLFDDRFGLAARRPAALSPLPTLPREDLAPGSSDGDICVQACSDDPQVAFHAVRNLRRLGTGVVNPRWMELGFGRTASTSPAQATPRNLMGFKDGTRNIDAADQALMAQHVWIGSEEPQNWIRGGSYLVSRKIRMLLEQWDRDNLADQQNVFGRQKSTGAPLTGTQERDTPDFAARSGGDYVIPVTSHVRLAAPENNGGLRILRRGYSYTDGIDPVTTQLLGGLFFLAYMKSPGQFVSLQKILGQHDALNEYIQHLSGGLFVVPPGLAQGQDWAGQLFG